MDVDTVLDPQLDRVPGFGVRAAHLSGISNEENSHFKTAPCYGGKGMTSLLAGSGPEPDGLSLLEPDPLDVGSSTRLLSGVMPEPLEDEPLPDE